MEWVFGSVIAAVFGLFAWSAFTTRREVTKKIQPLVDALFWPEARKPESGHGSRSTPRNHD